MSSESRPSRELNQQGPRQSSDHTLRSAEDHEENDKRENDPAQEEKGEQGPPPPIGFWDPQLHKTRIEVVTKWALTTVLLFAFILAVLSLYWGVLFRVPQNMKSLTVAVVDFDGQFAPYNNVEPIVGPAVLQAVRKQQQISENVIGWTIRSPAYYNNDPIAVRQSIYDEHDWAAVIINNNATALLQQAVATGNQTYDPLGSAQVVYVQARDQTTYSQYITPQITQFEIEFQSMFGQEWISQVLSNTSLNAGTYSRSPQALSPAVGFSTFNLRPFTPETATPAVTIGLIYLIIIAFFSFSFYLPIYSKFVTPDGHPPMHFWELILWRLGMTLLTYLFLSLAYSFVSLAFQIPFSNTYPHDDVSVAMNPDGYGKGSFVVYWMLNWCGMTALGLASENVTMVIGQPWTALWLIFWVISNVSTSFYAIPLSPGFFKWGYAWPLHHVVYASRTILFDTHSKIGLNFGVLLTWCAVNIALFVPCCLFFRWNSTKEQAKKVPRSTAKFLIDG